MLNITSFLGFLDRLEDAGIHYQLAHPRIDSIMVEISTPGQHWEVEWMTDGTVEIELFESKGDIFGIEKLEDIFDS